MELERTERDGRIPHEVGEEITGQYQGEELAIARTRRPTDQRIARLEVKHDELVKSISDLKDHVGTSIADLRGQVGELTGQLKELPNSLDLIEKMVERMTKREDTAFHAQIDIGTAKAQDEIDSRRIWRRAFAKIAVGTLGGGLVGGIVVQILHKLGWL